MPQNTTIPVPARTWTLVTLAAVTALRLQSWSAGAILVQATASNASPAGQAAPMAGAIQLPGGEILPASVPIADIWPQLGAAWIWVWSDAETQVSVAHA